MLSKTMRFHSYVISNDFEIWRLVWAKYCGQTDKTKYIFEISVAFQIWYIWFYQSVWTPCYIKNGL